MPIQVYTLALKYLYRYILLAAPTIDPNQDIVNGSFSKGHDPTPERFTVEFAL